MGIRNRWWLGALVLGAIAGAYAWVQSMDGRISERIAAQVTTQPTMGVAPSNTLVAAQVFGTWPDDARLRFTSWQAPTTDLTAGAADVVAGGGELYALGEFGGIYQSADAGNNWTLVGAVRSERRDDPTRFVRLAVLPAEGTQPAVYFALDNALSETTGDKPRLYRVSEGHTDVVSIVDPAHPTDATPYKVLVQGTSVLVAYTWGIARSDDRGRTWQLLLENTPCTDIVSGGRYVYAACVNLYRSVDGGPFDQIPGRGYSLAVAPSNPAVVYTVDGLTLYRTLDAGATWTKTFDVLAQQGPMHWAMWGQELEVICGQAAGSPAAMDQAIVIDPQNPNVVWWGYGQLYRSDDGAVTFGRASIRPGSGPTDRALGMGIRGLAFAPTASGAAHRLMIATSSGVVSTDNPDAAVQSAATTTCANLDQYPQVSYSSRSQGMGDVLFRDVAVAGDDGVLVTTARDRGFLMSWLDEPATWSSMPFSNNVPSPTSLFVNPYGTLDRFFTNICPGNASCRWDLDAATGAWIPTLPPAAFYLWGFAYDRQQPNRVWTSYSVRVNRSEDGLQTAALVGRGVDCNGPQKIAVSPNDSNLVIIAGRCGVGRRTDALTAPSDANWSVQRLSANDWTVNALEFDPLESNNVYLATSGEPSIYASTNFGATWTAIDAPGHQDGLPDADGHSLAIDPESTDILYLGTSEGLFVSWDTGAATRTWHEVPTPFRGMSIEKVIVRKTGLATRRVYVFTHGVGEWIADVQLFGFSDVEPGRWSAGYVNRLSAAGVTTGCGMQRYCPEAPVLREQMAAFLLRAIHGGSYQPPVRVTSFADVPADHWAVNWIEQLRAEGIATGCATSPARYCPGDLVPREQLAVFLLRAKHGVMYQPPPATGVFADVPVDSWAAAWIEQLSREGIANGCSTSPAMYCPADPVTREQMAAFLVRAFNL